LKSTPRATRFGRWSPTLLRFLRLFHSWRPSAIEFIGRESGADQTTAPPLKVGTRWIETRRTDVNTAKTNKQLKTVVRLDEAEDYPRSFGVIILWYPSSSSTPSSSSGRREAYEDASNTCTFTVQPMSEKSCALICSIAFQSRTMHMLCIKQCCGERLLRIAEGYLLKELQDYEQSALKREQKGRLTSQ